MYRVRYYIKWVTTSWTYSNSRDVQIVNKNLTYMLLYFQKRSYFYEPLCLYDYHNYRPESNYARKKEVFSDAIFLVCFLYFLIYNQ